MDGMLLNFGGHYGTHTGMGGGFFLFPAMMLVFGLAWLILLLWVVYDVSTRRDMGTPEKVLWIAVAFFLNVLGPIIYLFAVRVPGKPLLGRKRGLEELERLADLHERGALTDEEFGEMKEEILEGLRGE